MTFDAGFPLVGFKSQGAVFGLRLEFGALVGGAVYFDGDNCSSQTGTAFVLPSMTAFRAAAVDNGGRVWVEDPAGLPSSVQARSVAWAGECFVWDPSNEPLLLAPAFVALDLAAQFMQPFQLQ